jgi:hypothetical protein
LLKFSLKHWDVFNKSQEEMIMLRKITEFGKIRTNVNETLRKIGILSPGIKNYNYQSRD